MINIKKLNAGISLLVTGLLLLHALYQAVSYLVFYYNPFLSKLFGILISVFFAVHAVISLGCVFFLHDSKSIAYKKLNMRTFFQRLSALVMIFLLPLHIYSFTLLGAAAGTRFYVLIEAAQVLFFAALFLHVALSFTNALVSLGLLEEMRKKRIADLLLLAAGGFLFFVISAIVVFVHLKIFAGGGGA